LEKTVLLQAEALACVLSLAHVMFYVLADYYFVFSLYLVSKFKD